MRYKARKRNAVGTFTAAEWQLLLQFFGAACLRCGSTEPPTIDHVVPLIKGGSNDILNLQPLCTSCNCSKRGNTADYRDPALMTRFLQALLELD